jgi:phospholipid/cholesterol/gamma-HCH transport system substrate-binding protein
VINPRSSAREIWVGLVVIVAVAALIGLVGLASDGPGFLSAQSTVDVIFKDAQGVRVGSPVRVAGLDTGNVIDSDIVDVEGALRAKIRISLPASLVKKLRQDVKITIVPALTGMSHVNIVGTGHMETTLVPGQLIQGIETSFFDPIIEQVGLGPVERTNIAHIIGEVRLTLDSIAPRVRQSLGSLQETVANLQELSENIRPTVEGTVANVEDFTRKIRASTPKLEPAIAHVAEIVDNVNLIIGENRQNIRESVASGRDLLASTNDIIAKDRPKIEKLVDGVAETRLRADRVLYQADQIAGQVSTIMVRSRADVERSVSNVRDATDWAKQLIQKIYSNPFVLSPFYKPSHEDLRVQGIYDAALVFTKGAQEIRDSLETVQALQAKPMTPDQQKDFVQLQQSIQMIAQQLNETSSRLAESLKQPDKGRIRR